MAQPDSTACVTVELREYIEAILEEQRRGVIVAEQEREKAARALRDELGRAIHDGDRALSEHIQQQVHQIREALISSEKLEVQRIEEVKAIIAGVQREITIAFAASEKAIEKAEVATAKAFEDANEWRGQSADRERSQQEQTSKLSSTFLPREVADAQLADIRTKLDEAVTRLNVSQGAQANARRVEDRLQPWMIWMAASVVSLVVVASNFIPAA